MRLCRCQTESWRQWRRVRHWNCFQPVKLIQELRQSGSFFLVGLGGKGCVQIFIGGQDVLAKVGLYPGEPMVRQLPNQLRVGFVRSFVLAHLRRFAGVEILIGKLRLSGIHACEQRALSTVPLKLAMNIFSISGVGSRKASEFNGQPERHESRVVVELHHS
jgi:hypothetical protein